MTFRLRRLGVFLSIAVVMVVATRPADAQDEIPLLGTQEAPAETPQEPGQQVIEATASRPSDQQIETRLRSIFQALEAMRAVEVAVSAGVVTLSGETPSASDATDAVNLAERVSGVAAVVDRLEATPSVAESLEPGVDRLARRLRYFVRSLPMIGVGIAIFALFALVGIAVSRWRGPLQRVAPNAFIAGILAQAIRLVLMLAGLVIALEFIGATALLGAILGAAGILGLAIGFAIRDTIENYVASVLLSLRQPFSPDDLVVIEGHQGFVLSLTSRATVLLTLDGNHVRIPNAVVFKSTITNLTRAPERRFDFELGVNADANLQNAVRLGIETLQSLPFVLDEPRASGWIETVGDSSVIIRWGAWIDQRETDFFQARSEAIRLTKRALESAEFELPEPIYRLRIDRPIDAETMAPATSHQIAESVSESAEPASTANLAEMSHKAREQRSEAPADLLDPDAPRE